MWARRSGRNTPKSEDLVTKVCVIDRRHPLFGQRLSIGEAELRSRPGWIRVVLPDGRHRWVQEAVTDRDDSACDDRRNHDLPMVSVRTLLPLAQYVRARLPDAGERGDGTPGYSVEFIARADRSGSSDACSAEIVADDDTNDATTLGEASGAAALVSAANRRPSAGHGGST